MDFVARDNWYGLYLFGCAVWFRLTMWAGFVLACDGLVRVVPVVTLLVLVVPVLFSITNDIGNGAILDGIDGGGCCWYDLYLFV
jgi:hypothetical protein